MLTALHLDIPPAIGAAIGGWRPFLRPALFAELASAVLKDERALVALLQHLSMAEFRDAATVRNLAAAERWSAHAAALTAQADAHDDIGEMYVTLADRLAERKSLATPASVTPPPAAIPALDPIDDPDLGMLRACLDDLHALLAVDLRLAALAATSDPDHGHLADRLHSVRAMRIAHARHHIACIGEAMAQGRLTAQAAMRDTARHDRLWWDDLAQAGALLAQASVDRVANAFARA